MMKHIQYHLFLFLAFSGLLSLQATAMGQESVKEIPETAPSFLIQLQAVTVLKTSLAPPEIQQILSRVLSNGGKAMVLDKESGFVKDLNQLAKLGVMRLDRQTSLPVLNGRTLSHSTKGEVSPVTGIARTTVRPIDSELLKLSVTPTKIKGNPNACDCLIEVQREEQLSETPDLAIEKRVEFSVRGQIELGQILAIGCPREEMTRENDEPHTGSVILISIHVQKPLRPDEIPPIPSFSVEVPDL